MSAPLSAGPRGPKGKRPKVLPLSVKFFAFNLLAAMVALTILTLLTQWKIQEYAYNETRSQIQKTLQLASSGISSKIEMYNMLTDSMYLDLDLQQVLDRSCASALDKYNAQNRLRAYLEPLSSIYTDMSSARFLIVNSTIPTYGDRIGRVDASIGKQWYAETLAAGSKPWWSSTGDGAIMITRRLKNLVTDNYLGVLQVEIPADSFFSSLSAGPAGTESGQIFIFDGRKRLLYNSNPSDEDALRSAMALNNGTGAEEGSAYVIQQAELAGGLWRIYYAVPTSYFQQVVRSMRMTSIMLMLGCALVFAALSWFISRHNMRRIHLLYDSMNAVKKGKMDTIVPDAGNDEISFLTEGFNEMVGRLRTLIDELLNSRIQEKDMELRALQAQINPHFLYNTLSSISLLGMRRGDDDITRMSNALSRFYRISLSRGESIITVGEELELIRAYMQIQNIRFKDKIGIDYQVDETLEKCPCPKLILQPFVENAIAHGMTAEHKVLHIAVTVSRVGGDIVMTVMDDGKGFDIGQKNESMGLARTVARGYGIFNVDQRIKLFFGDDYGILMQSQPGAGTQVHITIPYQSHEG